MDYDWIPLIRVEPWFNTDVSLHAVFSTRALSTAGVLRLMGKVENAISKQVQQKMPETDSWFDERAQQVDALQVIR